MRIADIDILIVPGWRNAGPDHWQSRWQRQMRNARRVEQDDWQTPRRADWVGRIVAAAEAASRPVVLVAHGCGVGAVVHAAPHLLGARIAGALLVAPVDPTDRAGSPGPDSDFLPLPLVPLPFASKLIGSSTDPRCSVEAAQALGAAWGSDVSIIANAGSLDDASGHGPWPEGLLTFGLFLKKLG